MTSPPLDVTTFRGSAAGFHGLELPTSKDVRGAARLWWFEVDRAALVLGSAQRDSVVDWAACAAAGVEVVRRRSGGGAVLLVPGDVAWFDLVLERSDPRWRDDVGQAPLWVGRSVAEALGRPDAVVHDGRMVRTAWSDLVCFAGVGPGEVLVGDRKLAGVSQRRSRDVVRFQVAVYRRWHPEALVGLLSPPSPTVADLADLVAVGDLQLDALVAALTRPA